MNWRGVIAACLLAAPLAADPIETANEAIAALKDAEVSLGSAEASDDRVAALTETIQAYEVALAAAREGIREVTIRERSLSLELDSRREEISRLLGVLQTLERATTPLLLIHPTGALGTARGGMMLAEVTPNLQRQADQLGAQLEELSQLQITQEITQEEVSAGLRKLTDARLQLSQAIVTRAPLPKRFSDDRAGLQILANSVESLEEFATTIETLQPPLDSAVISFSDALGQIPLPVSGTIFRNYKDRDALGIERPGILVTTEPLALVTSPWNATVRFTGELLDYGNVIILEPENRYLLVLAGITNPYVSAGDIVEQNDPLGILNAAGIEFGENLVEFSTNAETLERETLYIEIREDGQPTDPADWFKLKADES